MLISPLILVVEEIVFVAEMFKEEQIILKLLYDPGILQNIDINFLNAENILFTSS